MPIIISRAVHRFIVDLTNHCAQISQNEGKHGHCVNYRLTKEHVKEAIEKEPKFKFLRKITADMKVAERSE